MKSTDTKTSNLGETFIETTQVAKKIGVSRFTLIRWVKEGIFPAPIRLASNHNCWKLSTVDAWMVEIINESLEAENKWIANLDESRKSKGLKGMRELQKVCVKDIEDILPFRAESEFRTVETEESVRYFLDGNAGSQASLIGLDPAFVREMFVRHSGLPVK